VHLNPYPRVFALISGPDPDCPGKFKILTSLETGPSSYNPDYYRGKVVVLVNETTISRGEFTCMALQTAPDVTVVGSQTAGADGNVSYLWLPGGIATSFSGLGVYYPDGSQTQRIGILPNITVAPTIEGIKEGRDEVLEEALQFIQNSGSQDHRLFKNKHRRIP
jgi:C-terminal processing protease CtpA/Prc